MIPVPRLVALMWGAAVVAPATDPWSLLKDTLTAPTLTNTRTGARKSIWYENGELAANALDSITRDGIEMAGSMDGSTNITPTDLDDYYIKGANSVITDLGDSADGDAEWRHLSPAGGSSYVTMRNKPGYNSNTDYTVSEDRKGVTGSTETGNLLVQVVPSLFVDEAVADAPADWTTEHITINHPGTNNSFVIADEYPDGADSEHRNLRFVNESCGYAAWPDGSAHSATYGTDVIDGGTPTWSSYNGMLLAVAPYNWGGADNPEDAAARIAVATDLDLYIDSADGSIKLDIGGTVIDSGVALTANEITTIAVDWNGTTIGLTVDAGTRSTASETSEPTSTLYVGNDSTGNYPIHGGVACMLCDHVPTSDERTTWDTNVRAEFADVLDGSDLMVMR